jgi:N,N'-diacetyllegionaminate synthase
VSRTLIIAEAGVNHNGDLNMAFRLVEEAASAGADIVKFQTFKTEKLVSRDATTADYQVRNTGGVDRQAELLKKLELTEADHLALIGHCRKHNIRFLSTAFDLPSVELLVRLHIDIFKIPSGEITNLPYLKRIGAMNRQVILSTGMSTLQEVADAIRVIVESGTTREKIIVLHCTTEYPAPYADVNLKAMATIKNEFNVAVGYSDHTPGIEVPVAAVALGASVIEKHFTLDRGLPGPDHKASLVPSELKEMVAAIRHIELALGDGVKAPAASELKNIAIARKSIHVARELCRGHVLTEDDLEMKRPGDGISPMKMSEVVGRKLRRDVATDTKLKPEDIE